MLPIKTMRFVVKIASDSRDGGGIRRFQDSCTIRIDLIFQRVYINKDLIQNKNKYYTMSSKAGHE